MQTATAHVRPPGYETRWRGLIFIGVSLIVISLDNTVLNVALPSIARTLNASASELQWIIDAYVLVFAALLLTTGALGDRIGRKKALQAGLLLFGLGSLAAALSTSTAMLIAARAFLGIGGAMIMPATLSIVSATFPLEERPQAIAIWAAVFGLGVGIGPVVGGWLVERFAWRSVFYVNLPVIVVALIGGYLFLAESRDEHAPRPDIPGVLLSIVGLFALIYAIIEAGVKGWGDPMVIGAFVLAFVVLSAFIVWERRTAQPMLPMHFFKNMSFTGANLALVFISFSLFGAVFFLTQYLQTIHGYTAFEAGVRILPQAISLTLMASYSARIARRIGTRNAIALGIFISCIGMLYMSFVLDVDTPYPLIALGQVIMTTGLGIAISPATNSVMASVPVRQAGVGSAMNDTTRQLGGAIGIAVLGTILNSTYIAGVAGLREQVPANLFEMIQSSVQRAHLVAANPETSSQLADTILRVSNEAFMAGMSNALLVAGLVMAGAALFTLLALPKRVQASAAPASPAPAVVGD